jgi:capsid protein
MGWFKNKKVEALSKEVDSLKSEKNAYYGNYKPLFHVSYDGEKNLGELGPVTKYHLDYESLRLRSWEAYLASDITQTIIKKYSLWIIGAGLKLQSEPIKDVLAEEGITIDPANFSKKAENRFKIFCASRASDYKGIKNLNKIARTTHVNAIIGGDVLTVLRVVKGRLKVDTIDGAHIRTPMFGDFSATATSNGNKIKNGIETNANGEHVAFHISKGFDDSQRIPAKVNGRTMAFLVSGLEYRIDDNRGIPLFSAVLETIKKLERYKEAAVGSAEERAKIAYFIEHGNNSTGESPLIKSMARAQNTDLKQEVPHDVNGKDMANNISVSTNKQTFNMPNDSTIKALESKQELHFEGFYSTNSNSVCATIGIPPDVAFSKYDSNYSASRAAIKDWEHTINVERKDYSFQFYQRVYNRWLEIEILSGRIQAPGYISAMVKKDDVILDAYRWSRFVGANVPHIDPTKEVAAERAKLGKGSEHIPLTTVEQATENLNGGEYSSNVVQYAKELEAANSVGVKKEEIIKPLQSNE